MKTIGVDPKSHGLLKELERVKGVVGRTKQIADKAFAPKVDVSAAKRFIHSGLWEPKDKTVNAPEEKNQGNDETGVKPPPPKRLKSDPSE